MNIYLKSNKIREEIKRSDIEYNFFIERYSNPIIIKRYSDALGRNFDEVEGSLQSTLSEVRIVRISKNNSKSRIGKIKKLIKQNSKFNADELINLIEDGSIMGFKQGSNIFVTLQNPGVAVHELSHLINSFSKEVTKALYKQYKINNKKLHYYHKNIYKTIYDYIFYLYLYHIGGVDDENTKSKGYYYQGALHKLITKYIKDFLYEEHLFSSRELHSRSMEIRFHLQKKPEDEIVREEIEQLLSKQDCSENVKKLIKTLKKKKIQEYFIEYINSIY